MIHENLKQILLIVTTIVLFNSTTIIAQNQLESQQTIISAVPFLKIIPDARSSALGDVGIATSPDANSMYFNASNLAFSDKDFGLSMTYTSWLRALGLNDIFLAYLSAYKKIGDKQAIGGGLRFFSVGQMQYTDEQGGALQTVRPYELAADVAYTRKLGKNFSLGLTLRYIMSNLGTGSAAGGMQLRPGHAFSTDISMTYQKKIKFGKHQSGILRTGLVLSNIGTKISYSDNAEKDYLPANLGLGSAFEYNFDKRNSLVFALDINKLLVPTPISPTIQDENGNISINPDYDTNGDGIPDYKQQSVPASIFGSMADAPQGALEEFNELMFSFGMEYWYNKQFALRCGYFYEHKYKGNRQFFTVGLGVRYKIFNFNFSYLIPTVVGQRNPLDNTLRFSLLFDFGNKTK